MMPNLKMGSSHAKYSAVPVTVCFADSSSAGWIGA